MAKVTINNSSFVEVLNGAGFVWCDVEVVYKFAATQPAAAIASDAKRNPRDQVNGIDGQILWAMLPGDFVEASVTSTPEV